jgi:hypothetical protein
VSRSRQWAPVMPPELIAGCRAGWEREPDAGALLAGAEQRGLPGAASTAGELGHDRQAAVAVRQGADAGFSVGQAGRLAEPRRARWPSLRRR